MPQHDIVAIGGSSGSITAIREICSGLPADFPAAVLIVIHVGASGRNFLAQIVDAHAVLPVTTAVDGERIERGHVYIAPADHHMLAIDGEIRLGRGPRENRTRPAIDPLFRSVAISCGTRAVAGVLTGYLDDGASGLADVKRCGGITFVQNPSDAAAPEMPLNALRASDVDYRAPLADIAALLVDLVRQESGPAVDCPAGLELEVGIALGRPVHSSDIERIARPVALSCPACGGVLSKIERKPPLRFRCQVGHAFSVESLAADQESAVDEAVRVALRMLEERAQTLERLAREAQDSGWRAVAERYQARARDYRAYGDSLQRAVLATLGAPASV